MYDSVIWKGIIYVGTQVQLHSRTFKTNFSWVALVRVRAFVLEVPPCNLRPSMIYSVPCDRIVQIKGRIAQTSSLNVPKLHIKNPVQTKRGHPLASQD